MYGAVSDKVHRKDKLNLQSKVYTLFSILPHKRTSHTVHPQNAGSGISALPKCLSPFEQ
jgi:hypothetical protein